MDECFDRPRNPGRRIAPSWPGVLFASIVCTICANPVSVRAQSLDPPSGPDITIISGEDKTIYEYRQNGHLRMVKIVPSWGKPYYLVPRDPTRNLEDLDQAGELLPSWVIVRF